jgi:multicomponent Na+:H+ antiporter subunit D
LTSSQIPAAIVLPPLLAALLSVIFALGSARASRLIVLAAASLSLLASLAALERCAGGGVLHYEFGSWAAPYGIVYRVDGLAAVMAALISAIGVATFVYAGPSIADETPGQEPSFFATASLLLAALLGMVVTGDLFNLYVFIEIASIAAYTLIAVPGGAASLASFRYLLAGTVGASFYLLGLAYLFALTGTLNLADMGLRLQEVGPAPAILVALAFIVAGLGMKMALFPMHGWLPDAYTNAPHAATAFIAAVMTKVNAFALLRVLHQVLWPVLPAELPLGLMLAWLGAAGILAGSFMALAQTDAKRLLAYSSVGHLGYVALGIGLGTRSALVGAMLHIVAHALTKCCLFLFVGGVAYRGIDRNPWAWAGLARKMPLSAAALVVASMSMIGVPPTAGFFGKWYLMLGALEVGAPALVVVLLVSSLLNAWYFFRMIERAYFGPHPDVEEPPAPQGRELPAAMLGPIVALAAAIVVVGVLSVPLSDGILGRALDDLPGRPPASIVRYSDGNR